MSTIREIIDESDQLEREAREETIGRMKHVTGAWWTRGRWTQSHEIMKNRIIAEKILRK